MQRMETLAKKEVVLMSDEISIHQLRPTNYENAMDVRGTATTVCPCGCDVWRVLVKWDEEEKAVGMYFLDMECAQCGTLATAPTPDEDDADADL